ncbi:MAG: Ig-like domain-containing protein [Betaproteobacteria bacterium]
MLIATNTTWTTGSVVNLTGEVQIAPGVVLSVEPGVTIKANGNKITAYGTLKLAGTHSAPIKLDNAIVGFGSSSNTPGDIQFSAVDMTAGSFLAPTGYGGYGRFDLVDSKFIGVSGFYIWYPTGPSSITRSVFDGSEGLSIGTSQAGTITVTNNAFANQTGGAAIEVWANYNNGITVVRNSFLSTDRVAIELPTGYSSASLIATNNYFGTDNTSTVNAMILDRTDSLARASVINYTPLLTQADSSTPVLLGPNTAPTAAYATGTTNEDTALTANLPTATDGARDSVTYAKFTNPSHGTVNVTTDGSYTYTPAGNYNGPDSFTYTVSVGQGSSNPYTVSLTVSPVNDAPTGAVTITGTPTQGQTLTASNTLADPDGIPTFGAGAISYQWSADGQAISGATGSTLNLTQSLVGKALSVRASYTDNFGQAESVTSSATSAVANLNDAPTGSVTITGNASHRHSLSATNTLADVDGIPGSGPGAISYQWRANGAPISGATGSTFSPTPTQIGKVITVTASYTDLGGAVESITSPATEPIRGFRDFWHDAVTRGMEHREPQALPFGQDMLMADTNYSSDLARLFGVPLEFGS